MSVKVGRRMGSESGRPMTQEEASALLGAYALGVLSHAERLAKPTKLKDPLGGKARAGRFGLNLAMSQKNSGGGSLPRRR